MAGTLKRAFFTFEDNIFAASLLIGVVNQQNEVSLSGKTRANVARAQNLDHIGFRNAQKNSLRRDVSSARFALAGPTRRLR
jgi:hypothetical protein